MLNPIERLAFACRTCWDVRRVSFGDVEGGCPDCSSLTDGERVARLRADTAARAPKPEIREADLTAAERNEFHRLRSIHPDAHPLTVLAWLEGRRYAPADDPEFVALCERRLAKWRFTRLNITGPDPGWLRAALAGEPVTLNESERELVESRLAARGIAA